MGNARLLILGGGPAGVGAAYRVRALGRAEVTVLELRGTVGGNAGSFDFGNQRVDYGSHRLHKSCKPEIMADIRRFLGPDLVRRRRHGRIRLREKWIHFPLKPADLILHVDASFAIGAAWDALTAPARRRRSSNERSFASVLERSLGPTICRDFYFPYARKIWGLAPHELAAEQAKRRVSANSFRKIVTKMLATLPGLRSDDADRFYYPRRGFGQISEAFADAAREQGARIVLNAAVSELRAPDSNLGCWSVTARRDGREESFEADLVWSTLPLGLLARIATPAPPPDVLRAAEALRFRAMLLIYLRLPVGPFTEFDAHYFPGTDVSITRLSEPANYSGYASASGSTVLCAELPCSTDDPVWVQSDDELAAHVREDLSRAGIPLPAEPSDVHVERLSHAYPIYVQGYDRHFDTLDRWADGLPNLTSFGRQGLFAHDNTHHALAMAYAAADCIRDGRMDQERWASYRLQFQEHVVED